MSVVDVLIMLGTDDSKANNWTFPDGGTSATQFAADDAAMVDHFTNRSSPSSTAWPRRRGSPIIDVNTPTAGHPEYFSDDGVHPSDVGYRVIAQTIYTGITGVAATVLDAGSPSNAYNLQRRHSAIGYTKMGRGMGGRLRPEPSGAIVLVSEQSCLSGSPNRRAVPGLGCW
jgi:hypothetical protein